MVSWSSATRKTQRSVNGSTAGKRLMMPRGMNKPSARLSRVAVFSTMSGAWACTGADLPVDGGLTAHGGAKPLFDALRPA